MQTANGKSDNQALSTVFGPFLFAEGLSGLTPTVTCCRRLRGSMVWGSIPFHGLTPTAPCGRRIRGLLPPPRGLTPGDYHSKNPVPRQCRGLGESGEAALRVDCSRKRLLQIFLNRAVQPRQHLGVGVSRAQAIGRRIPRPRSGGLVAGSRNAPPHQKHANHVPGVSPGILFAQPPCAASGRHGAGGRFKEPQSPGNPL